MGLLLCVILISFPVIVIKAIRQRFWERILLLVATLVVVCESVFLYQIRTAIVVYSLIAILLWHSKRRCLLVVTVAMLLGGLCGSIWLDNNPIYPKFYMEDETLGYYIVTPWSLEKWRYYTPVSSSTLLPYTLIGPLSLLSVLLAVSGLLGSFSRRIQLILGLFNTALITFILGLLLYLTFLQDNPYLPAGVSGTHTVLRHFFLATALFSNLMAAYLIRSPIKSACSADKMH